MLPHIRCTDTLIAQRRTHASESRHVCHFSGNARPSRRLKMSIRRFLPSVPRDNSAGIMQFTTVGSANAVTVATFTTYRSDGHPQQALFSGRSEQPIRCGKSGETYRRAARQAAYNPLLSGALHHARGWQGRKKHKRFGAVAD